MNSRQMCKNAVKAVREKKGKKIEVLELKGLTSLTDYFLICSGTSDRQVRAIADFIEESFKKKEINPLGIEGYENGYWILIDYGDIVIHVFQEQIRLYYDIEGLWSDAKRLKL